MASSRRAHQVVCNGLPSVGERAATSPHSTNKCQIKSNKGEGATSLNHGLPPQEGATSPRGAHLSSPHVLKSKKICNQSNANQLDLVPFDSLIDFAIKFSPNLSPFIFFIFDLADFY
jgi:hypothetical protein